MSHKVAWLKKIKIDSKSAKTTKKVVTKIFSKLSSRKIKFFSDRFVRILFGKTVIDN